ncbi:MAG: hypothetical protein QXK06_03710 [Candidatus Diapherotrites archaeon]
MPSRKKPANHGKPLMKPLFPETALGKTFVPQKPVIENSHPKNRKPKMKPLFPEINPQQHLFLSRYTLESGRARLQTEFRFPKAQNQKELARIMAMRVLSSRALLIEMHHALGLERGKVNSLIEEAARIRKIGEKKGFTTPIANAFLQQVKEFARFISQSE